jgi:nucleosome assembly protein 1-like 1
MMQVDRLEGTDIKWKSDSVNPTVKIMKKKAKAGKKPAIKKEKTESFFNIFSPPILEEIEDMDEETAEETQEEIEKILAMGEILREDLVPNAVRWFTGDAAQDDDEDDDEDEDDEDDDDEMYADEDDEDDDDDDKAVQPPLDAKEAECKQQ